MIRSVAALLLLTTATLAQEADPCAPGAEAADECLAVPRRVEATNFVPLLAPLALGAGLVAGLAGAGGGSGSSTPNTTK